jgi:hypothetical protein
MSKLGRVIQRRRQNRRLSIQPPVPQETGDTILEKKNGDTAPEEWQPSEIPKNELLMAETATSFKELTEICDGLKQASLERGGSYASDATRAMRMDLSSYRAAHEKGLRGLTVKSWTRYAEFFGINFEWLMGGNRKNHDSVGTSLDFPVADEDFELVLRHFWTHLDAEKRRKLIQVAAGLVDGCTEEHHGYTET